MVLLLAQLTLVLLLLGLLALGAWAAWTALRSDGVWPGPGRLRTRDRAALAAAVAEARWAPAHDEANGVTRILLRRAYTGLDGLPAVLEERVFTTFPAADPAWESRFTEEMSNARFRCAYLNTEESLG